jgi:outer membrane protein assembly factor BamB
MWKAKGIALYVLVIVMLLSLLNGIPQPLSGVRAGSSVDNWPMLRHDAGRTGYATGTAPNTNRTLWKIRLGGDGRVSSPVVVEGRLYILHREFSQPETSNVYCVNTTTGIVMWTRPINGGTPTVIDARVYIGGYVGDPSTGGLFVFDAYTGTEIWNYTIGASPGGSPAVSSGRVYFGTHDGYVYCLNATTGDKIWNYTADDDVGGYPAVAGGRVFVGSLDGNVYCLNATTGDKIWNYTAGDTRSAAPSVVDGRVFVGSANNNTYCLNATTGDKIWNYTTGGKVSSSAVVDGRVYVGAYDSSVYCLNATTGDKIWNYITIENRVGSPIVADGKVYVSGYDVLDVKATMYCLNAQTGVNIWSYHSRRGGEPAVAGGVLYFTDDGHLLAISDEGAGDWPTFQYDVTRAGSTLSSGPDHNFTLWTYSTGSNVQSSPAVVVGRLYISAQDGTVYCLNASTGAHIWNFTEGGTMHSPTVAGNRVYVGGGYWYNTVFCLDASTGTLLWRYETDWELAASPAVAEGRVYIGCMDDWFYCLDASTGERLWRYFIGENNHLSSPAVAEGRVYVGSSDAQLYCFDASNGTLLWTFTTGSYIESSPAVVAGRVYVGSVDAKVYCVDAVNGSQLWNYTADDVVLSSPAVANGRVYVGSGDSDRRLYCLNASTGAQIWNATTDGAVHSSPAVAGTRVYVGSDDTRVYCFDALTGARIWTYKTRETVLSSPAVADGRVYVGSFDDTVYAFGSRIYVFPVTIGGITHNVTVESNSLISGFSFDQSSKTLSFNATGTPGTQAFVDIAFPTAFLGGPFIVLEDSTLRTPIETANATHTALYLEYVNNRHTIEVIGTTVIPEFPTIVAATLVLAGVAFLLLFTNRWRILHG